MSVIPDRHIVPRHGALSRLSMPNLSLVPSRRVDADSHDALFGRYLDVAARVVDDEVVAGREEVNFVFVRG